LNELKSPPRLSNSLYIGPLLGILIGLYVNWLVGALVGTVILLAALIMTSDLAYTVATNVAQGTWTFMSRLAAKSEEGGTYSVEIGVDEITRRKSHVPINKGHIGVYGMTQAAGKSVLLHQLVMGACQKLSPDDVWFYGIDLKTGLDIFNLTRHFRLPIANSLDEAAIILDAVEQIYDERDRLFKRWSGKLTCENIDDYEAITGERLPLVILVFDEPAGLEKGSRKPIYDLLKKLVQKGASLGVFLWLSTQRPVTENLSRSISAQFAREFVGRMSRLSELTSVCELDLDDARRMMRLARPGLFYDKVSQTYVSVNWPGSRRLWRDMKNDFAAKYAGKPKEWPVARSELRHEESWFDECVSQADDDDHFAAQVVVYRVYRDWCTDNEIESPLKRRELMKFLREDHMIYTSDSGYHDGKAARGVRGWEFSWE